MQSNRIKLPVAFICDAGYVMQTAVAIRSLLLSRDEGTEPDIRVICTGLRDEQREELLRLREDGMTLQLVSGEGCFDEADYPLQDNRYRVATRAALLKFYLPRLLPDLDRVLYLDGDIIVRKDLSALAAFPLEGALAAVVRDLPQVFYKKRLLGDGRDYFNSGVMLLDLAAMRREGLTERLAETRKRCPEDKLMDQNAFNLVLAGRVRQLPIEYNVCYANLRRRWLREGMCRQINEAYGTRYRRLSDFRKNAAIIHYSSGEKPWKYFDIPAGDEWTRVYRSCGYDWPLPRKSWQLRDKANKVKRLFLSGDRAAD